MKTPLLFTFLVVLILQFSSCFHIKIYDQKISVPSYNVSVSKDYTILAVTSYCGRKCLENWTCQITNDYLKDDKVTNITFLMGTLTRAAGFVAYDHSKNLIVVSLRGSANAQNWISDFSFDLVSYSKCKDCKVHLGFIEDFKSIQHKLNSAVDALIQDFPNAEILSTGHSMGAALSVIVGIELKLRHSDKIVEIHNIGCPRVGNPSFAQFVQSKVDRIFRVVHNRDLIVHLPPLELGFHHPAYQIFWDQAMDDYVVCNQTGQDKTCSNKFSPQFKGADHDFYFWNLNKILKC